MEEQPAAPKRRRLRVPVLTVLVCTLVVVAFMDVNVFGFHRGDEFSGKWGARTKWAVSHGVSYAPCAHYFLHGWPVPFAKHEIRTHVFEPRPPFLDQVNPSEWCDSSMISITAAICDVFLSLILLAPTTVVVLRLERRGWTRWQFSIADMFSLIATTSMVLGLVCLDDRLSVDGVSVVDDMKLYVRLRDLPLFDRVMVLLAIACAVWLIVSTAANRLGDKYAKKGD